MNDVIIRTELPTDRSKVATLLARVYGTEGVAAIEMAGTLRDNPKHPKELCLVAEREKEVIGFTLLTPVSVSGKTDTAVLVAPIAVDPASDVSPEALFEKACARARAQGFKYVLLHTTPTDPLAKGMTPAAKTGIASDVRYAGTELFVKDLDGGTPTLSGKVEYPFGIR
jgi:predicted N-acetyltransferase YhbS